MRSGAGILVASIAVIILVPIVSLLLWWAGLAFQESTANYRGKVDVANKTKANGSYRIAAYDSFFNLCAQVQSTEASINAQRSELTTKPSQGRVEQVNANIAALQSSRAELINQYNADAAKTGTLGQFRSSGLPYRLDSTEKGTTCVTP